MTQRASEPVAAPEMYAVGEHCTWHGFLDRTVAIDVRTTDDATPQKLLCCPVCQQTVRPITLEKWLAETNKHASSPEQKAMVRWSMGKCFPDEETLVNAYRQAMEE